MCLRSETRWVNADDYALRSMAETRARSKALRGPLEFVVSLAGFMTTPAEEMPQGPPPPTSDQFAELKRMAEDLRTNPDADLVDKARLAWVGVTGKVGRMPRTMVDADELFNRLAELDIYPEGDPFGEELEDAELGEERPFTDDEEADEG
jgi:hypothetical protein